MSIWFDEAFPELDGNLLLLLGISNGIYVGAKAAEGESPIQSVARLDIQLKVLQEAKANADGEVARLTGEVTQLTTNIAAPPAGSTKEQLEAEKKLKDKQLEDAKR